jgi:hypothetical protein
MRAPRLSSLARTGTGAAAVAIAITGALGAASAADAATSVHHLRKLPTSLSIRKVKHPKLGFDVVSGNLRTARRVPLRGKDVLLESRTPATSTAPASAWAVVDQQVTGLHGAVAFKENPAVTTRYKLVFRAHPNFRHSQSGVVTIVVKATTPPAAARTSLSIREVKHPKLGFDVISGNLRTGHKVAVPNETVLLESRTPATSSAPASAWAVVDQQQTGVHGAVAFKEDPAVTTRYKLVHAADAAFRASQSGVVTVRVAAPAPTS